MKKISHFFDFATTVFGSFSASLLDSSFSQPLLYHFIFNFKLAKVLRLETFRLVDIGKSVVGYTPLKLLFPVDFKTVFSDLFDFNVWESSNKLRL